MGPVQLCASNKDLATGLSQYQNTLTGQYVDSKGCCIYVKVDFLKIFF